MTFAVFRHAVRRNLWQKPFIRLYSSTLANCPSCNAPLPTALPTCTKCYTIQPIDPSVSFFDVFGYTNLKNPFAIDVKDLRFRFLQAQRICHPDSWSQRGSREQNIAAAQSSQLNKAYQTLLSPLSRAEYILAQNGYPSLETDKLTDTEFIMEVMEVREDLEAAQAAEDIDRIQHENNQRIQDSCSQLDELLGKSQWQEASIIAMKLKYWQSIEDAIKEKKSPQ